MYMDDIKVFAKNAGSEDIQSGPRDRIWHRKTLHGNNEKRKTPHVRLNGTAKSRNNQDARTKGNLEILENIADTIKQVNMNETI